MDENEAYKKAMKYVENVDADMQTVEDFAHEIAKFTTTMLKDLNESNTPNLSGKANALKMTEALSMEFLDRYFEIIFGDESH